MFRSLCVGAAMLALAGCDNFLAKNFGGTVKIDLEPGLKVMMVTWKENDIWVQSRPMEPGETPTTVTFKEWSKTGFLSGKVIVVEHGSARE